MIITNEFNYAIRLLKYLDIDPNKFDINSNLVLSYYKKKHGKQYAFITDQHCEMCIYWYNKFESTTNVVNIREFIDDFAYHLIIYHQLKFNYLNP